MTLKNESRIAPINIAHLWEQCPINIRLKSLLKCENQKCYIFRWKFDLDLEVKVKLSNEIKYISFLRLSKTSNRVLISHQMAEILRFMWKWPWPQFQGHGFDMSKFFCTGHSQIYKIRLNCLRTDWVMPLFKWLNVSPLTHFLRSRDDLEG